MGFTVIVGDPLGTVGHADNFSFDGTQRDGVLNSDGQLWIGATTAPNVKRGTLTSPLGTVSIGYSDPDITLDVITSTSLIFNADTDSATPLVGVINIFGTPNGITTSGIDNTITIDFDITEVPSIATTYTADTGTATPDVNNLNVLGGIDIATSALGDTIQIDFTGSTALLTFDADTGTAQPIANSINILGGTEIATSAVGDTLTIDFTGSTELLTFDADTGTANPVAGVINILGTSAGIDTTATENTITIDFDVTEIPTLTTSFTTDSGTATPSNNNINFLGGTDITITGSTDIVTVSFTGTPTTLTFAGDSGTATALDDTINLIGGNGTLSSASESSVVTEMQSPFTGDFVFESNTAGDTQILTSSNTSNTANSSAAIVAQIAGPNALSPYFGVALDGADSWSMGIDNDRRSRLFFTYNDTGDATPNNATNFAFRIEADSTITGASNTIATTSLTVASGGTASGSTVLLHCQNAENAVDSDAEILIETADPTIGAGGGSGSIRWGNPNQNQYALGMSKGVSPSNQPLELLDGGFSTAAVPIIQFNGGIGGIIICNKAGAFQIHNGTTAQRPSPASNGMIRYNTSTNRIEGFENGTWVNLSG